MVEGSFGSEKLRAKAPSVQVLFDEMSALQKAHDLATFDEIPQTVIVDGQKVVVEDQGPTRIVTYK